MGGSAGAIRHTLLQATWEVAETEQWSAPDPRYPRYAAKALSAFKAELAASDQGQDHWVTDQFVAGELERRLRRFREARDRFEMLQMRQAVAERGLLAAVQLQLRLIDAADSTRHSFPDAAPGERPEEEHGGMSVP